MPDLPDTVKCPHCGALYEIRYEHIVCHEKHEADCQICGKHMHSVHGSIIPRYQLVAMPDGTHV